MQPEETVRTLWPHFNQMAERLWPILRASVTPIAHINGDSTIQLGTGTFFRVADASFVVTAGHVWTNAERAGYNLHLFNNDGNHDGQPRIQPVPLEGNVHYANDPADVAVFELAEDIAVRLGGCRFLRLADISLRPQAPGWCWVFGFPAEIARPGLTSSVFEFNPLFLGAGFYQKDAALVNYDPDHHFLLDAARDDLWSRDGTPGQIPHRLEGISGCSVWQTWWPGDSLAKDWNPERARIVGVQTSYYRNPSLIKATPWAAVAGILYRRRPDLKSAIEMNFGPVR